VNHQTTKWKIIDVCCVLYFSRLHVLGWRRWKKNVGICKNTWNGLYHRAKFELIPLHSINTIQHSKHVADFVGIKGLCYNFHGVYYLLNDHEEEPGLRILLSRAGPNWFSLMHHLIWLLKIKTHKLVFLYASEFVRDRFTTPYSVRVNISFLHSISCPFKSKSSHGWNN